MGGKFSERRATPDDAQKILGNLTNIVHSVSDAPVTLTGSAGRWIRCDHVEPDWTFGDIDVMILGDRAKVTKAINTAWGAHKVKGGAYVIDGVQVDINFHEDADTYWAALFCALMPAEANCILSWIAACRGFRLGPKGLRYRESDMNIPMEGFYEVWEWLGIDPIPFRELLNLTSRVVSLRKRMGSTP